MKPIVVHIDRASKSTKDFGERLSREAEAGQSVGVAAIVLQPRGRYYIEVTGSANRDPTRACGAVSMLRRSLERLMEGED